MASLLCFRCLRRTLHSIDASASLNGSPRSALSAAFSSSANYAASRNPLPKKGVVAKSSSARGKRLHLTKNKRAATGRPPAPGERKALRRRIVLSNTNALEVPGLRDLTAEKLVLQAEGGVALDGYRGQVLGLSNDSVDALRALDAFKPTQGWSLFRRPASLVRRETVELANDLARSAGDGKETVRKMVFGGPGGGKSVLLLQAQAMAFLKGFVVVHLPEAQDLTIAHASYRSLDTPDGTIYIQPHYTAKLLSNIATANRAVLSALRVSRQHTPPVPIQPDMSLFRLAELGGRDPELAWPVWRALWSELMAQPSADAEEGFQRPPVLVSMDGVDQAMRMSAYLDAEARPVHAHDLALVKDFMDLLSGRVGLPNGGMVVAATCASNRAASPTLDHQLKLAHAQQHNSALTPKSATQSLPLPEWNPYTPRDERVVTVMDGVEVINLQGLSKDEARGVMEYYARSGMLRENVTEGLICERWTLAGSGIIRELEKGSVRLGH